MRTVRRTPRSNPSMMSPIATSFAPNELTNTSLLQQPAAAFSWFSQTAGVLCKAPKPTDPPSPYSGATRLPSRAESTETTNSTFLPHTSTSQVPATTTRKKSGRKSGKSSYKHIPHRDKPPHLVARRNARERRRVQAVNSAFAKLRKCVPVETRGKRLSKVKTLHRAIEYINCLQSLLKESSVGPPTPPAEPTVAYRSSVTSLDEDEDDDDIVDDDEDGDGEEESDVFRDLDTGYLASDEQRRILNKENNGEQQPWIPMASTCESGYEPYVSYYSAYHGSVNS